MRTPAHGLRSFFVLLPALAVGCLALGCGTPPKPEEASVAPVKVALATEVSLASTIELLGVTQPLPDKVARISARVDGQVKAILVGEKGKPLTEGQEVEANQIIVQLDDRLVRANLAKAQAALDDLVQQDRQAELTVAEKRISLNGLEKIRPSSVLDPLAPVLALTPGSWILTPVSVAMDTRAPVSVSRVDLEKARLALETAWSQRKASQARLAGGAAEVQALTQQLEMHTLRAPIAGRLGLIQVSQGQSVTVGTPIAEVVHFEEFHVLCYVSPRVVRRLKRDQAATLKIPDALDDVDGVVEYVALTAQPDTGNFAVKVLFRNKDLVFRVNSAVRIEVEIEEPKLRLTIPESAVMEDSDPPGVIVVEETKVKEKTIFKAKKLTVELGVRDREKQVVEIKSLKDKDAEMEIKGQRFITEGGQILEDGDVLKVEEAEEKKEKEK